MENRKIYAWALERYLLGELPKKKIKEIDNQLKRDSGLREEIERLIRSNEEILNQCPPDSVIHKILSRYKEEKSKGGSIKRTNSFFLKRLLYASPIFAAALILLVIVLHRPAEDTRIKGIQTTDITKTHLILHRKNGDVVELLENGDKAKSGDLLQIAYVSAEEPYGVILSIDGNGVVILHYPEGKDGSTILELNKKVLLGSAYELDDAPEFERFFFITSNLEIKTDEVLKNAEALAKNPKKATKENLELPETFNQYSIILRKGGQQ